VIEFELQQAVFSRLKADPMLNSLVAGRVYDQPPTAPAYPYVSIGPDTVTPARADCYDGSDVTFQVDAWSRAVGFPEVKRIGAAVRAALTAVPEWTLSTHRVVDVALVDARTFRDPDGLTSHTALNFRALTEPV
jgi:hypothetical protein